VGQSQLTSDVQQLAESLGQLPEPVIKPAMVIVSGLPGTGKSHFCSKLAERQPFVVLESDALRKTLFSSPSYSPQESSRLFQALHLLIKELLKKGTPTILDATNLSESRREYPYSIAEHLDAKLILVRVEAPSGVVYERLKVRQEGVNPVGKSGADWKVYEKMKSTVQKIKRRHYAVDTSRDITPVLDKIVREVNR